MKFNVDIVFSRKSNSAMEKLQEKIYRLQLFSRLTIAGLGLSICIVQRMNMLYCLFSYGSFLDSTDAKIQCCLALEML